MDPSIWILLCYMIFEKSPGVPTKGQGGRESSCSDTVGVGADRLLESLPGCVKRCSGGTNPPAAWPIHFRFGPYRE